MTDSPSSNSQHQETGSSLWQRFIHRIRPKPNSSEALHQVFADAEDNQVIGAESRIMLEGVLRMAELTAGKVMVAAARMDLIHIDASLDETMHQVIDTAHSRFPVYEGERDNIIGILLAKDLLKLQRAPALNIRTLLRPPVFIPESKGLNDLLRDFRNTRNHMALVVDEFGRVAGLITIEDVLEQIVGDIEDEFDEQDDAGDIYALVDGSFRVSGDTAIERVEEAFETPIFTPDEAEPQENRFDTIGGFIAHAMGHVPRRGEFFEINGLRFQVLLTKAGAVKWFKVFAVQAKSSNSSNQNDKAP